LAKSSDVAKASPEAGSGLGLRGSAGGGGCSAACPRPPTHPVAANITASEASPSFCMAILCATLTRLLPQQRFGELDKGGAPSLHEVSLRRAGIGVASSKPYSSEGVHHFQTRRFS